MKPLENITVLDFGQFLSAPSASLKLADLGAEVIKVENPRDGDICRYMYISNCKIGSDSSLFLAINRNKDGIAIDLKDSSQTTTLHNLIKKADVMIVNFRPGVAERLHIDYQSVKKIKSDIIYGEITGYGKNTPLSQKPGQDLLVQALSGITYLNGNQDQPPTPLGLSVADLFAGQHLAQGILASLYKKVQTREGGYIHVSLLESILDIQFEVFTTYLNDGHKLPVRSAVNNANAYIDAPYGIYKTTDGYIAIAMVSIPILGKLIDCLPLTSYINDTDGTCKRDEIKQILSKHLLTQTTAYWLSKLEPADIWCSDVFSWNKLFQSEGFKSLDMIQNIKMQDGCNFKTTRCPITIDKEHYFSSKPAPIIGQDNCKYLISNS